MEYTDGAKRVLEIAKTEANNLGQTYVGSEHILLGLIEERKGLAAKILIANGIDVNIVKRMISENIDSGAEVLLLEPNGYSPSAKRIVENAEKEAQGINAKSVGTEHFLLAILKDSNCLAIRILNTIKGINLRKMYFDILDTIGAVDTNQDVSRSFTPQSKTPVLDNFSRDLTKLASQDMIDPVIGRDKEINRVIQILSRRTKNNPCLIGEPGVGKTAIAEGLAIMINKNQVPENMYGRRLVSLDLSGMVAGTKYRGEFEERIKRIIDELKSNKEIILFIDEIHTLIGAGGAEGALDAANILKPALARGDIQVIGATTIDEYRKHIEKDSALERRFQTVNVEEPNIEDSISILRGLKYRYENFHNVIITDPAVEACVNLSSRYIQDRKLPDKAIDLLDEACSKKRIKSFNKSDKEITLEKDIKQYEQMKEDLIREGTEKSLAAAAEIRSEQEEKQNELESLHSKKNNKSILKITYDDIADIVAEWTGIPVKKITEDENNKLLNLENDLHKRIIGQNDAVSSVSKAIRRNRVGLKDPNRPIGTFLFLGPTGVGKTELCKAIADIMFGSSDNIIRIDMSEYMEKYTVSKLIGSPPGYVGYDEGGQLTEKIRRKPYSVVLFDEIEKAHEDVYNILLQIMDEGHITDSQGRKVSFKNSIVIMTSNVGATAIIQPKTLGFDLVKETENKNYDLMKDRVMDEVKKTFKPEFINRIDEIIVFHKLDKDNMSKILDIKLEDIIKRTKDNLEIDINLDDKAKEFILDKGFDEQYGARKLKRVLTQYLEDFIADEKLSGHIKNKDKIVITSDNEKLKIA